MKKGLLHLGLTVLLLACNSQSKIISEENQPVNSTSKEITSKNIPTASDVKIGTLSNGVRYYIKKNGKPENKVELRLAVKAGSILEDEDQQGLAHFMEHMNFNGTKNFEKNDLVDYLQSIGVKFGSHLNAYTSFDETVYILPIPSDDPEKLEKGFQILEDWAHNALLTDEEIDKERGVVLEEYRLGKGADERMMQNYLPKVLYGSKYAKRLPIGKKEIIENFDYETIRRFYKDWYRPDLMAVMAVGDIDVATLEEKIQSHFGKIPVPENPRPREVFTVPNHDETFIAIESDEEATFSRVQVMFKDKGDSKSNKTVDEYRHSMVESLFSGMINSRLNDLRNSENPPFVYGYTYHGGTWAKTKDAYQSFAVSSETGQLKALQTLLEENEKVKRFGFNKGELERAKKKMISRMEKAFKDKDKTESKRIVGEYVRNFLTDEPIPGIEWEYNYHKKTLPKITLEEVNALIQDYIKDDNRVVILTGPKKEGLKQVTKEEVQELLDNLKTAELKPYEDEILENSLITNLPDKGNIIDITKDDELDTTILTLSNGATVTYKITDFKNDEILFNAFSFGGTSLYSDEEIKATAFANGGLTEAGINGFSKVEMGKMMSGKIVGVNPSIRSLSEQLSGSSTPKDFETLFQMTHLYFTSLNKDQKAFNSYINKQKAFLGNVLSNPQIYYQIEMGKFINGKSPRFTGFPNAEKLDKADYDLAYKKYQERFANAGDFKFYFVGNIDEEKLMEYSETYLASLPSTEEKEIYKVHDFRPLSGAHEKIVYKGKDPKSSVQIRFQGETKYDPKEAHAFKSLGEVLSIKLIEKLREDEGGVYGVGARGNINKIPYGWFNFSINFPCGPENVDKLKAAALAEVNKLVAEGPTDEDLEKVKKAQILDYKENIKKNRFWLGLLKNADYQDKNAKEVFNFEENVNALTKADLQNVAKKYLTKGAIIGIHNPEI